MNETTASKLVELIELIWTDIKFRSPYLILDGPIEGRIEDLKRELASAP